MEHLKDIFLFETYVSVKDTVDGNPYFTIRSLSKISARVIQNKIIEYKHYGNKKYFKVRLFEELGINTSSNEYGVVLRIDASTDQSTPNPFEIMGVVTGISPNLFFKLLRIYFSKLFPYNNVNSYRYTDSLSRTDYRNIAI